MYTISDTSQLLSVPYALHAKIAENYNETDPLFSASPFITLTQEDVDNWVDGSTEIDPVFLASVAYAINKTDTTHWNGILDESDPVFLASVAYAINKTDITHWNSISDEFTETDPVFLASVAYAISEINIKHWSLDLDSFIESDPVFSVSPAKGIIQANIDSLDVIWDWYTANVTEDEIELWKEIWVWYYTNVTEGNFEHWEELVRGYESNDREYLTADSEISADSALSAVLADHAVHADTAEYALRVDSALSAALADSAIHSGTAQYAPWADSALFAYSADSASLAYHAVHADTAQYMLLVNPMRAVEDTASKIRTELEGLIAQVRSEIPHEGSLDVGMEYGGGIIFWLDSSGVHGLIAATSNAGNKVKWGEEGSTNAIPDGVYAGMRNTDTIIAFYGPGTIYAAHRCANYTLTTTDPTEYYDDWYLPSKYELKLLYDARADLGDYALPAGDYWSSTEYNPSDAWVLRNGAEHHNYKPGYSFSVRAIRAF